MFVFLVRNFFVSIFITRVSIGQEWTAFLNCSDDNIDWNNRCEKIIQNLLTVDADIICLQEISLELHEELWCLPLWTNQLHRKGYTAIILKMSQKDWTKTADYNLRTIGKRVPTGLVTFYKNEKFEEVIESEHGHGSGIIVFLKFKSLSNPNFPILAVHNLHLIGHPSKFDAHEHQLNGALKHFRRGMKQLHDTHHYHHIYEIICGDFNSDVDLSFQEDDFPECITLSQWIERNGFNRVPTGKSWAQNSVAARIDHILYHSHDNDAQYADYKLNILNYFPHTDNIAEETLPNGIPNENHPSDHILMHVDFELSSLL